MIDRKLVLAIDFDGTIVEHEFPDIGKLRLNVREVFQLLSDGGHFIIIWTCRTSQNIYGAIGVKPTLYDTQQFLIENIIPFDTINHNNPNLSFQPSPKVYADVYIDDRQLGGIPEDWFDIYDILVTKYEIQDLREKKPINELNR